MYRYYLDVYINLIHVYIHTHMYVLCAVLSRSVMSDSVTPWIVACQAPLSMGNL